MAQASFLLLLILLIYNCSCNPKISFETSHIQLPVSLSNHVTATYSNKFVIIGGNVINGTSSYPSLTIYFHNDSKQIFESNSTEYQPLLSIPINNPIWDAPIICNGQCSTTVNNKVYIFQWISLYSMNRQNFSTPWMLVFDLDTLGWEYIYSTTTPGNLVVPWDLYAANDFKECYEYDPTNCINRFKNDTTLCTFSDGSIVYVIAHIDTSSYHLLYSKAPNGISYPVNPSVWYTFSEELFSEKYFVLMYDTVHKQWKTKHQIDTIVIRDNYGCTMINGSIFIDGGEYENTGIIAQLMEKCDLTVGQDVYQCVSIGSMDYRRSHLQLTGE